MSRLPGRTSSEFLRLAPVDRVAACLVALAHLPGLGPATLRRCHLEHGAEESWFDIVSGHHERVVPVVEQLGRMKSEVTGRLLAAARDRDAVADLDRQRRPGWAMHVLGSRSYPARLAGDPAAPAVLFSCGSADLLAEPTVALVGTRGATLAGRDLAESMAADLVRAGVVVVSGLALGIDGAAHRGALAAGSVADPPAEAIGGRVLAVGVVASGLDITYPRRHADLHRQIAARGLLVSETPAGIRPDAWRFPARNRIIAGLSDAVVVVESRAAGGSMHTVDEALARDVPVLAVPGHPGAPASAGTNALLFDGAGMARGAEDVLLALGVVPAAPPRSLPEDPGGLAAGSPAEASVLEVLRATPSSLAEVVAATGRSVEEVSHALAMLEVAGHIGRSGAWYEVSLMGRLAR